jgi:hypothetical protein
MRAVKSSLQILVENLRDDGGFRFVDPDARRVTRTIRINAVAERPPRLRHWRKE